MWLKKILSVLMVTVCLCTCLCFTAYAEENDLYISDEIVPAYEIAQNPSSVLTISGTSATCECSAKGDDCVSITVTHAIVFNRATMKEELDAERPVVVSGNNNSGTRHFALVVSYTGNGTRNSDFTVIDPWHDAPFPTTYDEFVTRFPNDATISYYSTGKKVDRPMLIFK